MKIESRGISITDVPRVRTIVVAQGGVSIQLENMSTAWTWTFAELREFHAAIGEALKHDLESTVTPVEPKRTEWVEGDPEPEGVTEVIDCDGDTWNRFADGWSLRGSDSFRDIRWKHILREYGPFRLPEDAE